MAGHTLLVHPDVDTWVRGQPTLRRRVDWLLFELTTRGEAGRPKGIVGPAARVRGRGERWRRSGVGGFHYYAWWFPTAEWDGLPSSSNVVVRAIRHHDDMGPLAPGRVADYRPRPFADLEPLTEEQDRLLRSSARVRVVAGQPGTGKTGALIFAAIREAASLPPDHHLLYVTLSRRLATLAEESLAGVEDAAHRVRVVPLADLLAEWGSDRPGASRTTSTIAPSEVDEERAFLSFAAGFAPRELAVWADSAPALWAEVRAHILGATLPFPLRDLPASRGPILDERSYQRTRERLIGGRAARAAWRVAQLFVERRDLPSVQREAWKALERLQAGTFDGILERLGGLIVDEVQDLTLLQIAVLAEAARRAATSREKGVATGESSVKDALSLDSPRSSLGFPLASLDSSPLFIAAGDESQIVHPSGFDWGWCKDLLFARLGSRPEEIQLHTNQRSAAPLIAAVNQTALLYDELPKEYRPRSPSQADPTEAPNGEVVLTRAELGDDELGGWLERLADTPHSAVIVDERADLPTLAPRLDDERFRDLLFTPEQIKGLDRQYVVVWDATRRLERLRDTLDAAHGRGQQPRFLVARTAIDELRVAVSRATETLVFLDPPEIETDPLLTGLPSARRRSVAFLRDRLEERNADPRERALGFLEDAGALLESDLDRARRTLVRAEAALAELVDAASRREPLERAVVVRRHVADALLRDGRYAEATEQLEKLEPIYRELGDPARAEQHAVLAQRYRDAPPDGSWELGTLPFVLAAYVDALGRLPAETRTDDEYALPRAWLEEAV
ncbi:MAG: AAA family ATPase, partial [Chloroflexi bacterium]|nr:AAA family ATPase [Chloroflexota bacterium]